MAAAETHHPHHHPRRRPPTLMMVAIVTAIIKDNSTSRANLCPGGTRSQRAEPQRENTASNAVRIGVSVKRSVENIVGSAAKIGEAREGGGEVVKKSIGSYWYLVR